MNPFHNGLLIGKLHSGYSRDNLSGPHIPGQILRENMVHQKLNSGQQIGRYLDEHGQQHTLSSKILRSSQPAHKQLPEDLLLLQPDRPSLGHEEKGDVVGDPFLGGAVSDVYLLKLQRSILMFAPNCLKSFSIKNFLVYCSLTTSPYY